MNDKPSQTPRIIVSQNRETLAEYTVSEQKILIGRSEFADIVISDLFASKLHAMILVYSDALVLLDLNSANGVTVNSVKTQCSILKENDIITIGHHRLKIENVPELSEEMRQLVENKDTLRMKNIVNVKRLQETQRRLIAIQNRNPL
ncbi:MAG: FHA domain-containing protein [Proteobacteria bacterium]|nr:FHA domain-containing protein [Pseudomonadota bacterium]